MSRTRLITIVLPAVLVLWILLAGITNAQLPGTQLTTHPAHDLRPAWSPDGAKIAFFSARSGNYDVWVMEADGSNKRQLTRDPADDRRPAWSPDGTKIAFDSDRSGHRDIWVMNADGSDQRPLTSDTAEDSFPSWSPDGTKIAFYAYRDGTYDTWIVNVDGNNLRQLTSGQAKLGQEQCTFACHQPAWSPDGKKIVYHTDRAGTYDIMVMDADGTNQRQLTSDPTNDYYPLWTPDGKILYMTERYDGQRIWNDVMEMDADGDNKQQVLTDVLHGGPLAWSPDGTKVAFHSPRAGNFDIYVAVVEDGALVAPLSGGVAQATAPVLAPTSVLIGGAFLAVVGLLVAIAFVQRRTGK